MSRTAPNTLSLLTPVHCSTPPSFLEEAADSVRSIRLPRGWELEWIVHEDGDQPVFRSFFESLEMDLPVSFDANYRQFGAATTRTACLIRSRGSLVMGLDADDFLVAEGVTRLVEASLENPDLYWFTGQTCHLIDGERVPRKCDIASGIVEPGIPMRTWVDSGRMPFPTAPVMLRSAELWKLGGWPAVVRSEDASLLFAYSADRAGMIIDDLVYVYRKWADQTRDQPWWTSAKDLAYEHRLRWAAALLGETDE